MRRCPAGKIQWIGGCTPFKWGMNHASWYMPTIYSNFTGGCFILYSHSPSMYGPMFCLFSGGCPVRKVRCSKVPFFKSYDGVRDSSTSGNHWGILIFGPQYWNHMKPLFWADGRKWSKSEPPKAADFSRIFKEISRWTHAFWVAHSLNRG